MGSFSILKVYVYVCIFGENSIGWQKAACKMLVILTLGVQKRERKRNANEKG